MRRSGQPSFTLYSRPVLLMLTAVVLVAVLVLLRIGRAAPGGGVHAADLAMIKPSSEQSPSVEALPTPSEMEMAKELLRITVDYDVPVDSIVDPYNIIIAGLIALRLDSLQTTGNEYTVEDVGWLVAGD